MNNNKLLSSDNIFTDDEIRKVVMNSLASSPTVSSSSSSFSTSAYKPSDASIHSCISYLRFKIPSNLPNDYVLDKFMNLMKEYAPNERINWRSFRQAADTWITSVKSKCPNEYDFEINVNNGETADSPDEGITNDDDDDDDDPDVFQRDFNDSGKSTELVECSILNNSSSKITTECNKLDNSVKLIYEADIENTESELLRKRIYQFEKDNAWLREELMKSEESENNYKQLFYSFRQKYDRRNEEYRLLERENDEKNEIIDNMNKDQKHFQVAQEKWERERKTLIKKIEIDKQNTETYRIKYDKAENDKKKFSKQLNVYRRSLDEKEDFCNVLQKELNQLKQTLKNLEDYYEKIFSELKEQNEDLKRKNFKLELKSNDGKPSSEQLHLIPSAINLDISFDHSPDVKFNNPSSDSLYDELKASGFSPDVSYENSKIRELEEELDWQDEKIRSAVDQIEYLIKYVIEKTNINNNRKSNLEAKYILILLDKISQLSEIVTDAFQKRFTHDVSCQVSEDPWVDKNLQDLKILTYENFIKPNNSSNLNTKENLLSTLSSNSVDTKINPYSAVNCDNNKKKNTFNNKLLINETRIVKKPSQILTTKHHLLPNKNTEWSPIICNSPIMSEKNAPRRKISVFARTSDLDKILESQSSNDNFTSSTPVPDPIPELNTYRTAQESSSDSSGNLSQLQASLEENSTNDCGESTSVANNQIEFNIAPAKFNFAPAKITKQSLASSENLATTDNNTSQFNLLGIDKKLIESSTPISNDDQYNSSDKENKSVRKELKNVTWTIESGSNSGSPKQFYNNRNKCDIHAVTEKAASELAAVTLAMSSGEDSSDSSDSDSAITCDNKDNENDNDNDNSSATNIKNAQYTRDSLDVNQSSHVNESFQVLSNPVKINLSNGAKKINDKTFTYKPTAKREILPVMKRSRSESENLGCGHESNLYICDVEKPKLNVNYQEFKLTVFPSLTDFRLQESGIAHLSDTDDLEEKDLVEGELERKYVAFSLGLCTDRLTLSRRKTLSQRRRDQTERNFTNEVTRMQQSIEELAPLCFDSETIDRIERARNQIEIIAQCARKVSCAAETLGAIQQEYRISRAIHLADRYLRLLRSRCEKLDRDLTESKRILAENNIIVDESNGENGEEFTVIRYRGLPTSNRTMIARRRASIATIFRPIGIGQDVIKDGIKQRNSVTGRVTVRRPSLSVEAQSWQVEKLIRTESSNSVGELHEIFEHAESRRGSREENNNVLPVLMNNNNNSNNTNNNNEGNLPISSAIESCPLNQEEVAATSTSQEILQSSRRVSRMIFASANQPMTWRTLIWCIMISFLVGFFMKDVVSLRTYDGPLRWSSFQEFLGRHEKVKNSAALPL